MATRRMFSKEITNSSEFLMMSQSAQNLYFHFGMNADDDGFCEVFTVMRMTDSKPDDLKSLHERGFVYVVDSKICIVKDWHENNQLRADRYKPSKYFEDPKMAELYAVIMREKIANISQYQDLLTKWQPNGNQMAPQVRIEEDRIEEDRTLTHKGDEGAGASTDKRSPDVQELWEYGKEIGFSTAKERINRFAIARLIKNHSKDLAKKYAEYSQAIRQHQYAPQINNWMDLEEKLLKLRDFADRQKKKSQQIVSIDL